MRLWFSLLSALWLGGCASLPSGVSSDQQTAERAWARQQQRAERITNFVLRGRVAGGTPKLSANLAWTQSADGRYELQLSGPLGIGALRVEGDAESATISRRNESVTTGNPQRWIEEQTGLRVPLQNLRWWVRGIPAPDSAAQLRVTAAGEVRELQQSGWILRYGPYMDTAWGPLPKRLDATQADVTLTFLIDDWSEAP